MEGHNIERKPPSLKSKWFASGLYAQKCNGIQDEGHLTQAIKLMKEMRAVLSA